MCKVISVVNQKGGVGKTTTTVNVGIGLAREGKKVLLIDADPQGSLTASLGYEEPDDLRITLATIMMDVINEEEISLEDGILHHQENVDLLPANIELSALEVTMGNVMSREMIMKEYIDAIRCRYDYILIDCMPSLGMMTINALVSSDSVLIPVQAAYLPVKGLQQLILTVKKRLNRKLAIEGILLTMVDFRTNYARDMMNKGLVDIALFMEPVDTEGLDYIRITDCDHWCVGMRPDDPLAEKEFIRKEDLIGKPLILPERVNVQSELANWFGKDFSKLQIAFTSNLGTNAGVMAANGLGYPVSIEGAAKYWREDILVQRRISPEITTSTVIAWRRNIPYSLAVSKMIEEINAFQA